MKKPPLLINDTIFGPIRLLSLCMNNRNKQNHISRLRQTKQLRYKQIAIFHQKLPIYTNKICKKQISIKDFSVFKTFEHVTLKIQVTSTLSADDIFSIKLHQVKSDKKTSPPPKQKIKDSKNKTIASNFSMLKWM